MKLNENATLISKACDLNGTASFFPVLPSEEAAAFFARGKIGAGN
jgi:hypothetical protein